MHAAVHCSSALGLFLILIEGFQGVMYVMNHFKPYRHIPQIKDLSERLERLKRDIAVQIRADFEEAHSLYDCKLNCQPDLADGCLVMDALEPRNKLDLINWFLDRQLTEYKSLFREYDEVSWLDKCDRRYYTTLLVTCVLNDVIK